MDDRKLLELAAKAIYGRVIFLNTDMAGNAVVSQVSEPILTYAIGELTSEKFWNPLIDDGDALKLMVKLRLDISFFTEYVSAVWSFDSANKEDFADDPYAATRRAIVRAAAEIGMNMP